MRLAVVSRWPKKSWILREFATTYRTCQGAEPRDAGALATPAKIQCPSSINSCTRARSTNAILQEDVFDENVTAARPWEEVPGPKPLPLVGNTWRFIPYVEMEKKFMNSKETRSLLKRLTYSDNIANKQGSPRDSVPAFSKFSFDISPLVSEKANEQVGHRVRLSSPMDTSDARRTTDALLSLRLLEFGYWNFSLTVRNAAGGYSVRHVDKVCTALRRQYGRCVRLSGLLGRPDMLFVFDADEVERVFRGEDGAPHRPSMPSLNYYKHVLRKDFFGAEENCAGVIAVHGESWAAFRAKVSRVVLSAGAALQYAQQVATVADDFVERVREIRTSEMETPGDILNEIHKWSLESLALIALDTRLRCFRAKEGSESERLIEAVNTFFLCVGELELRTPWWRLYPTKMFKRYVTALDTILSITLDHVERSLKSTHSKTSLLNQLVAAAGPRVATVAALDMFLVGIDTTSNAVASILYQLSLRPEVQERLYEEISTVLQGGTLQPGDLAQMPYLKACIKEVLRMYPVVIGNGRQLTKDTVICGYNIPKGTQVIFQHYVMGNSDAYFEKASEFRPERWLRRTPGDAHHAFASLPFGFGKRMCLGRRFAELEIQTVVCKMIQAFQMSYDHLPLDYHIHPMYTPNGPIRLTLIDR